MAGIGRQRKSAGRKALGLFVAVWLNIALQPCTMAAAADGNDDCQLCPPAEMQGHHGMHDGTPEAAAAGMPCADGLADCLVDEDLNYDARGDTPKLKDAPVSLALAPVPDSGRTSVRDDSGPKPRYTSVHPGAPPPIHKLNCVYLD